MISDHQGFTGIPTLGHLRFIVHISVVVPEKSRIPNQTCVRSNYSSLYRYSAGGNILTFSWSTCKTIYLIIVSITLEHNKIICSVQADHKKWENSLHFWINHFICRCTSIKHFWVNMLTICILMVTWGNTYIWRILPI